MPSGQVKRKWDEKNLTIKGGFVPLFSFFFPTQFITIQCNLDKHCQLEANYIQLNLIIQNSSIRGEAIAVKGRQVDSAEKRIRDFKSV